MAAPVLHLQTPAVQDTLPLELAPLVFQFLPVETIRKFPENDPLLIAVLKIQDGCRPFKVTYQFYGPAATFSVEHKGFDLEGIFSREVLSSLGVLHKVDLKNTIPDRFASMFCKNDKTDDSSPCSFSRTEELRLSYMDRKFSQIDLRMFPKLKNLYFPRSGITISPSSRTVLLDKITIYGSGSSVSGICDVSRDRIATIEMNRDRSQGFMRLSFEYVDWKPCFDRSWCRSMELRGLHYSVDNIAILQGFPNLKTLKFVETSIYLSQEWLPRLPLERLFFRQCHIEGTEFGFWPLVKELEFKLCTIEPFKGHLPKLESLTYHDPSWLTEIDEENEENYKRYLSVPIAKENLRKVKSFSLSTMGRRFNLSSFEQLKDLELWRCYKLKRVDGLKTDTLERVTNESCSKLEMVFPCHVSVKISEEYRSFLY